MTDEQIDKIITSHGEKRSNFDISGALKSAYALGAEEMRERAAKIVYRYMKMALKFHWQKYCSRMEAEIHALPTDGSA